MQQLDTELELIQASILPTETLTSSDPAACPREISIDSADSRFSLQLHITEAYPAPRAVRIQVKAADLGRDEAEGWRGWVDEVMSEWDASSECV